MKRWFWLLLFLCPLAIAEPGDENVLAAREAYRNGDPVRLGKQLEALRAHNPNHQLEPWLEYWQLSQRVDDSDGVDIVRFLARQSGSYLAEKLRGEWLKALGKRQQWDAFQREYPPLVLADQEISCYAMQGRLAVQHDPTALDEARPLWFSSLDLPGSCATLMEQLIVAGRIDGNDVWERIRRLLEERKLSAARQVAEHLPKNQIPTAKVLGDIANKPQRFLDKLPGSFLAQLPHSRMHREMLLFAVARLAKSDPAAAAKAWQKIEGKFSESERNYAWGQIAWVAARSHLPEALSWYAAAKDSPLSETQLAWLARAALRAQDWPMVQRAILRMPAQMAAQPDWVYWRARALAAHGLQTEANALYLKIAGQPNFYGSLADDELGRTLSLPPSATPPSAEELAAAVANPGLQQALALIRLDMRTEGVREWNWTMAGMDDRQLLAAAYVARNNNALDRAISASVRTVVQHDYSLRYPAPFRNLIDAQAKELALDPGWIYGLLRQESRFVTNAKSSVGAKGLMQLMPKTARWVAKKIGLKGYRASDVAETNTNVTLGTNYLHMVLASLDNQPVLAVAAYNAGPGRARRWRAEQPLEGAIYVETIPFTETRDYVKKVMSNAMYYSALFEDKEQSLKSRIGVIGPRGGAKDAEKRSVLKGEDLP